MTEWEQIKRLIPHTTGAEIDWSAFEKTALSPHIVAMRATPQNPAWHGEGDVWTHTKMVCEAMARDEAYLQLPPIHQEILFISALLHDIGKPACTVLRDGIWQSPRHTVVGAHKAREFLWVTLGMSGTPEAQSFRESVSTLVRCHGIPLHLYERPEPERKLIEIAATGELAPDFSLALLRILVRADVMGRVASDTKEQLETAECAFLLAEELGVLDAPYRFPSEVTRRQYLSGKQISRDYAVYDDTWREVVMLSGLPGTGKDTWIRAHYPNLPVISLDDIRVELGVDPADRERQGIVVSLAKERAKELLRAKQSFVWNATSLATDLRKKLLDMFHAYNAFTHIVFLETDLETELARNKSRKAVVPMPVIERMLSKIEPPTLGEGCLVEWILT